MAYRTRISGSIEIEPPIPWGDIMDSKFLPRGDEDDLPGYCIELDITERDITIREGTLRARAAVAIRTSDPHRALRAYGLLEEVQEIIDEHGAGRTFTGALWCRGDNHDDLWQLRVVDGKAVRVTPTWPPMPNQLSTAQEGESAVTHTSPRHPAQDVADWNTRRPVGTPVRYQPYKSKPETVSTRTRSAAWVLGGHTPVVMVDGIAGGVALDHITVDHEEIAGFRIVESDAVTEDHVLLVSPGGVHRGADAPADAPVVELGDGLVFDTRHAVLAVDVANGPGPDGAAS